MGLREKVHHQHTHWVDHLIGDLIDDWSEELVRNTGIVKERVGEMTTTWELEEQAPQRLARTTPGS